MVKKYELNGHKLELIGLVLALLAAFWQATLGGWWDRDGPEWQYAIQEEVNISVLYAIEDLATLEIASDLSTRNKLASKLSKDATQAVINVISMRENRNDQIKGSAAWLSKIGFVLFFLSALSIITGKYMVYLSIKIDSKND